MICSKGCGKVFLYAPDDREQREEKTETWFGFVRCPCGVERCISVGSFRQDYRAASGVTAQEEKP
jgi:hypothetical protein